MRTVHKIDNKIFSKKNDHVYYNFLHFLHIFQIITQKTCYSSNSSNNNYNNNCSNNNHNHNKNCSRATSLNTKVKKLYKIERPMGSTDSTCGFIELAQTNKAKNN